ncbi:peptide deformylase [bacterium]|nr:peptide deformylase [bacterium]MBU1984893.1 peptide deformylase [bacterium]
MSKSSKHEPMKIVTYGHPTLRVKCVRVTEFNEELHEFADRMFTTMFENEGVGLAASQVDRPIQLLVVAVPKPDTEELFKLVVVNPEIIESRGSWDYEEGCLSVPDLREMVTRPEWIRLKYQDLEGTEHEIEVEDLIGRVLQHEIDNLNGILFVDRLSTIRRALLENKLKQLAKENARICM